jgi:hypothetical protein
MSDEVTANTPLKAGSRYEFVGSRAVAVVCDWVVGDTAQLSIFETITADHYSHLSIPGVYEECDCSLGEWLATVEVSPATTIMAYLWANTAHGMLLKQAERN